MTHKVQAALIISILLLNISTAYAARTVSGMVPKVGSLQPLPTQVAPNYSSNIEEAAPAVQEASSSDAGSLGGGAPQSGSAGVALGGMSSVLPAGRGPNPWPTIIILILGGAAALGFVAYSRKRNRP